MAEFFIGLAVGLLVPLSFALTGIFYLKSHPERLIEAVGKKMVQEFKAGRELRAANYNNNSQPAGRRSSS